jgi:hypothetical protein
MGFFEIGSHFLHRLASNCDPPDLCFLSNQDYRCEPPVQKLFAAIHKVLDAHCEFILRNINNEMKTPNSQSKMAETSGFLSHFY